MQPARLSFFQRKKGLFRTWPELIRGTSNSLLTPSWDRETVRYQGMPQTTTGQDLSTLCRLHADSWRQLLLMRSRRPLNLYGILSDQTKRHGTISILLLRVERQGQSGKRPCNGQENCFLRLYI